MAKKGRSKHSSHKQASNPRRKFVFAISILLIGFMIWQILMAVTETSAQSDVAKAKAAAVGKGIGVGNTAPKGTPKGYAFGKKGRICAAEGAAAFFSFCKVGSKGKGNSCGDGCTCDPFMKNGKWGVCKTAPPAGGGGGGGAGGGTKACGVSCTSNAECSAGYCYPVGFDLCPTAAPGQPTTPCAFATPDPALPSVCMPDGCKVDPALCSCPAPALK